MKLIQQLKPRIVLLLSLASLATGCATTQTADPSDPWESWNRPMQTFNDHVDDYVMKPVARGYRWITPAFVDKGISNFFGNLTDIRVVLNDVLQGKFAQSASDGARLLVNTTAGVGGFIDVASEIDLPRHNEDFDQTLGVWGIPTGPYLVLPLIGPSSPRGVLGLAGDIAANPISYTGVYFAAASTSTIVSSSLGATHAIDLRADNIEVVRIAREAAIDRYAFFRAAYLSQRRYLVSDGNIADDDVLLHLDYFDEHDMAPVKPY
ncbi:MAG: VacJ family lipoprotein [Methylomonas sp.]|nr:VacJ family lipoprotein [Methylomonas sp.]PPD22296.1 MAG: ABC transporter [Methylomonas sp.]PPD27788.1 MAG: ABC transporter [Methylomonas sp.]PPD39799.1 MAG: ABC transporter [Methylomonas sp.]PPD42612.1 MAG: ABC transporter [Methylomonas sp.]